MFANNAFASNILTNGQLSKIKLSKIIQSAESLGAFLGKFTIPLTKVADPLAKNVKSPSAIDISIHIKTCGRGFARVGKIITLVI